MIGKWNTVRSFSDLLNKERMIPHLMDKIQWEGDA